jgi:hypothetical protein
MAEDKKLNDIEVWDRLNAALDELRGAEGQTIRGETALRTARDTLSLIQMGHLSSMDSGDDRNAAIKSRDAT